MQTRTVMLNTDFRNIPNLHFIYHDYIHVYYTNNYMINVAYDSIVNWWIDQQCEIYEGNTSSFNRKPLYAFKWSRNLQQYMWWKCVLVKDKHNRTVRLAESLIAYINCTEVLLLSNRNVAFNVYFSKCFFYQTVFTTCVTLEWSCDTPFTIRR